VDGTLWLLHHPPPAPIRRGTFDCGSKRANLPHTLSTAHFQIRYGSLGGGLTAAMYGAALERAYHVEVGSFGWAKPPVIPNHHLPGARYPIRIEPLGSRVYGFTTADGTWAGAVGDNPATPWRETDAEATCMSIGTRFPSRTVMQATAAHEFVHMIQYGLGTLDTDSDPDDSFVEGTAAWMEGEVVPQSRDAEQYLWPDITRSMGDFPADGFTEYGYWLVFRGLTERFGTGNAGGGEDVMQDAWEAMSKGKKELPAMATGVASKGTTLGPAFHAAAVAYRFSRKCEGGYVHPLCFDQGDRYLAQLGRQPATGSVTLATPYDGQVLADYSANWVRLPSTAKPLSVTVRSTGQGKLRASVDCDTGSKIRDLPFPQVITPANRQGGIRVNLTSCAGPAFVTVTDERVSAPNPDDSPPDAYEVSVDTPPDLDGTITWGTTRHYETSDPLDTITEDTTNDGSATLHLVPVDPNSGGYAVEDSGASTFTYSYSFTEVIESSGPNGTCTTTSTETAHASGKFSTYSSPAGDAFLGASIEPGPTLNAETDIIGVTMTIPVVVDIHNEGHGSDPDCPFTFDDQRDDDGPIIDFAGFRCEPGGVVNGPYPYLFEGKWKNQQRVFNFTCSSESDDFNGHGTMTTTGHLTAS
jgi:hypothetical protein